MFFDEHYLHGLPWYWSHFAEIANGQKRGEIATTYFDSSLALQRLRQFPDLRVIINVRNPVERTYSLFCHHRVKGRVPEDFFEAVKVMPRIETSGRYAIYCERWEQAFGKERCHYVLQQDVASSPQHVINEVCDFLAVEPLALAADAAERFGQLTRPRWPVVAKTAATLATAIRSRGLHRPIEFAKCVGLKRFVYGHPAGKEVMPADVQRYLKHLHSEDVAYLQDKFAGRLRL